ncbi:DNA polymerase [Paenibacillus dendritiformis]|uniref:DNA polymerase n=1 Tax=Paenibacillus dendritiformis TaxID=130049 RepID=UPI001B195272|nr:DNA polymerase [Paenibacillus dendritiformis]GIO71318.1 DNA polymerase [Paenibacillus dendritiformis]
MTRHLSIDIETYSSIDIKKAGLYKYVQSPDFQILLFAWSFDFDRRVQIVDLAQGESLPLEVIQALNDPTVIKHAYNAAFEWYCLNKFWPSPIEQWHCTQVHGLYCGYPAGLAAVGEALSIPQDRRKLGTGGALIRTFCVPCKPTKKNGMRTRTLPHHEPAKWELFKEYCVGDVVAEKAILRRLSLFPVPASEWRLWELDQRINARGLACDLQMVEGALAIDEQVTGELKAEAIRITGLDNPKSVQQLTKWLEEETGEEIENLQKGTVSKLIDVLDEGRARRVLEIRQELSKTSVKKYQAMKQAACEDGRVRGLLQFYGANRTGRWAGRLVQIQNLPRNYLSTLEYARQLVKEKKVDMLKFVYGNVPDTLSQLIRTAFVAPDGKTLLVADFSAIEARVIAWLAGEQWRLDVFNTHGKIYEASASQMFGVPIEQIGKGSDLRQKGKVAELALGYQGGKGALISMGALDMGLTEDELPDIVLRWRNANRRIVDLWYSLEAAALDVMQHGETIGIKGLIFSRESHYGSDQDFFTITLPSGRKLYYAKPFIKENDFGKPALHYWGVDQTKKKWTVLSTYGGKLTENVVQAIARDCLAVSLTRLEQAGYETVLHVHDEVGIEADNPDMLDHVLEIMGQPVPWAPGLPLKADGFATSFYQKD